MSHGVCEANSNAPDRRAAITATQTVDFGAERVAPAEKSRRVRGVFDAVTHRYDAMNDIMSLGSHRLLKRVAVEMARLRPGKRVLDLAGGTGDVAVLAARQVAAASGATRAHARRGQVVLADINRKMLAAGRDRALDRGCAALNYAQADAESLPFQDDAFDAVLVAFGVRNFTNKAAALAEMRRVLRPQGVAVVLEFATVGNPLLARAFDAFKATWPVVGRVVAGEAAPYRYLVDSIREHPRQDVFRRMMEEAGFASVEHHDLLGGAAAIHRGFKQGATLEGLERAGAGGAGDGH